jgi:hypothetical protein
MPERHTVDFKRCSFNVVCDGERRTITLQFDTWDSSDRPPVGRVLKALRWSYGGGPLSRIGRWIRAERNPFVLPTGSRPHPDNPDVHCFEIGVRQNESVEGALGTILGILERRPDYLRTIGPPLDRDAMPPRVGAGGPRDVASAASVVLRKMLMRRKIKAPAADSPEKKPSRSDRSGDLWDREIDGGR